MKSATVVLAATATIVLCLTPTWAQEPLSLQGTWWQEPAQQTRHTTLVASFNSAENNDADYSRDMMEPAGWGMDADVDGAHGSGTQLAHDGGYLQYRGGSSFQGLHGTVRMQVKGQAFAETKPFWIFDTRAIDRTSDTVRRIGVKFDNGTLSLVMSWRRYGPRVDETRTLDLDGSALATPGWHSIVASWDRASGMAWITLDGRGLTGPIEFAPVTEPAYAIFVGGSAYGTEVGGSAPAGITIDDLVLYDVALPVLDEEPTNQLAAEDLELLPQAEAAARKTLDLLADLQNLGGWEHGYSWPTLIGASGAYRDSILPDDYYINDDKGNSSMAVVQDFTYGYDVLGDARYVNVMLKTADFLVAGQQPGGYWSYGYYIRPSGVEAKNINAGGVKLQDHVQSFPLYFLMYASRLTGEQRYMDAAMKAGEFYLTLQNPDGSYSHHYDPATGMGRTHTNKPQGGELNDGCTNDAVDVLALMYHFTRDPAYVQALKRVGDWLIEAQGDDIPLWGDQYDNEGNLIWARDFEPPAYSAAATQYALEAILEVYRFSQDERYVEPIRKMIAWSEQNLPNGMMYFYHEEGTGRPIAATRGSDIYHLDDPEELAAAMTPLPGQAALGRWTFEQRDILGFARRILAAAEQGKPELADVTPESALEQLPRFREFARQSMATQNEAGVWVKYDGQPTMPESGVLKLGSIGAYVQAVCWEVRPILRYIELARMATGEIPAERRGQAAPRATAYPYADWYEVDWDANTQ